MKTRDKILKAALDLFNTEGVPNVSLRRIAAALDISQGNLNYHFKKREEIIEALYYQLLETFEAEKARVGTETLDLNFILDSTFSGMQALYRFRFLMIDFNQNMRENPGIHEHFKMLETVRKQTYLLSFQIAVSNGIMREEEFSGEYERLTDRIRVFSDYWIASSQVYGEQQGDDTVKYYYELLVEFFYPYFTDEARAEFRKIR